MGWSAREGREGDDKTSTDKSRNGQSSREGLSAEGTKQGFHLTKRHGDVKDLHRGTVNLGLRSGGLIVKEPKESGYE